MSEPWKCYLVRLVVVLAFVIKLEAVTVNPLCPTNKIAPHRRNARGERRSARTIGAFYNLLVPDQNNIPSQLQEEPENDADDCGDIEDYDENDLSSLTTNPSRREGRKGFGDHPINTLIQQYLFNQHKKPTKMTTTTTKKTMIYKPTRPPTGGYFGTNGYYRPQPPQQPSEYIKPVQEDGNEPSHTYNYRPNVVGALSGNIVGAVQVKPTRRLPDATAQKQHVYSNYAYPPSLHSNVHNTQNRPRYIGRDSGIIHSFIDLIL